MLQELQYFGHKSSYHWDSIQFYKWKSLDRALFCYKAHTEKAWAQNKYRDKQVWHSKVFLHTSWAMWPLPKCFTAEQSTVKAFFFALRQDFVKFRYFELILRQSIGRWHDSFSSVFYTLIKHAFSANQCMLIWTLL